MITNGKRLLRATHEDWTLTSESSGSRRQNHDSTVAAVNDFNWTTNHEQQSKVKFAHGRRKFGLSRNAHDVRLARKQSRATEPVAHIKKRDEYDLTFPMEVALSLEAKSTKLFR
ncbi:hypothetical protein FOZ61_007251 [Perkinsus olseni]|uniref:Uncharacterized protein n=1 Tax=Perkinsus olseni TaxID=32597 RepID=A0A7J6L9V5_PEROL|nr:hypothetical protein FOZ61_007251 [Perkinsus olseni]